jgi:hypothetical protein
LRAVGIEDLVVQVPTSAMAKPLSTVGTAAHLAIETILRKFEDTA